MTVPKSKLRTPTDGNPPPPDIVSDRNVFRTEIRRTHDVVMACAVTMIATLVVGVVGSLMYGVFHHYAESPFEDSQIPLYAYMTALLLAAILTLMSMAMYTPAFTRWFVAYVCEFDDSAGYTFWAFVSGWQYYVVYSVLGDRASASPWITLAFQCSGTFALAVYHARNRAVARNALSASQLVAWPLYVSAACGAFAAMLEITGLNLELLRAHPSYASTLLCIWRTNEALPLVISAGYWTRRLPYTYAECTRLLFMTRTATLVGLHILIVFMPSMYWEQGECINCRGA